MSESKRELNASSATVADHDDHTLRKKPWLRWTTPWSDIVGHQYKGAGTEADPYVISWLPEDPENPMNFGNGYKWGMTMLAATGTLAVTMGSSMLSAAIKSIRMEFPGHNSMLYIMITGIYVLGFVVGPLLWAPMSEIFGRRLLFVGTYIAFTAFNAACCGAKDINTLLVLRFFAGTFGSSTMTNSGGTIADMFSPAQRGAAMGIFAMMPMLGPAIGPVAGGFLSDAEGWVWVAALIAIFSGVLTAAGTLWLPETYEPVLLRQRARRLTKYTGHVYRYEQDVKKEFDARKMFLEQLKVPYKLLFTEPIVAIASLYLAVVYAIMYMEFTAFPIIFQQYRGWSSGVAALAFIGITIGSMLGLVFLGVWVNPRYAKAHEEKGYLPPEARLPAATVGSILLPVGLFIFAWTCVPVRIHWIGAISATLPIGAGIVLLMLGVSVYLVDTYLLLSASVMAAATVTRSILGVVFPLFTVDMYTAMGPNWAGTFVALLACVFIPCPILMYIYGRRIRRWTKPGRDADDLGRMIAQKHQAERARAEASGDALPKDSEAALGAKNEPAYYSSEDVTKDRAVESALEEGSVGGDHDYDGPRRGAPSASSSVTALSQLEERRRASAIPTLDRQ